MMKKDKNNDFAYAFPEENKSYRERFTLTQNRFIKFITSRGYNLDQECFDFGGGYGIYNPNEELVGWINQHIDCSHRYCLHLNGEVQESSDLEKLADEF